MPNNGYKGYTTLEQYYVDNSIATGITKPNNIGDPDYVAPVLDLVYCAFPSATPSVTPTLSSTPSITVTPSTSISITPTITASPASPSITPTVSNSPSISNTPSISITPTSTPSISITPSITPSTVNYIYYQADRYNCINGICNYVETMNIANENNTLTVGRFYRDNASTYIFNIVSTTTPGGYLVVKLGGDGTKNCNSLCLTVV